MYVIVASVVPHCITAYSNINYLLFNIATLCKTCNTSLMTSP